MRQTYSVKTLQNCGFYVLHKLDVGDIYEKHPYFAHELEDALEMSILKQTKRRKGGVTEEGRKTSVDLSVAVGGLKTPPKAKFEKKPSFARLSGKYNVQLWSYHTSTRYFFLSLPPLIRPFYSSLSYLSPAAATNNVQRTAKRGLYRPPSRGARTRFHSCQPALKNKVFFIVHPLCSPSYLPIYLPTYLVSSITTSTLLPLHYFGQQLFSLCPC
jgi:hypothetical protein